MRLIIIIPCFNEEKTIGSVIDSIPDKIEGLSEKEIIVIDDGSEDDTPLIAAEKGVCVISGRRNLGVGQAFQTGLNAALDRGADIIVNIDGDGQFNPADISKLIVPVLKKDADFVTASRFMDKKLVPEMSPVKKWGNRRVAGLISFLVGRKFYDVSCGFRAYSQKAALQMNLFGKFTYTQETFLDLAFKDIEIMEIPLKIRGEREFGDSHVASNLLKYAFNSLMIIFRTFRDYKPMRFFGAMSAVCIIISFVILVFFFWHRIVSGAFTPHIWAGFTGAAFGFLSIIFFITGLLADMLDRIYKNQERILFYEKRKIISDFNSRND